MKRGDDVFLFTLVDFLLQILFFGLLLYVLSRASAPQTISKVEGRARAELLDKAKVSNLVELTDLLTKMGPLEQLPGTAEFFRKNGSLKEVKASLDTMQKLGGTEKINSLQANIKAKEHEIEGLKTEMKAWGTPSCLYVMVAGKVKPRSIAKVMIFDDRIELAAPTEEMLSLLSSLKIDFGAVKILSHSTFRTTFAPVVAQKSSCRYFLDVTVKPKLYSSMQVVWSAFRTQ